MRFRPKKLSDEQERKKEREREVKKIDGQKVGCILR